MKVLVTGAAGFIGFHVAQQLIARGDSVVGFDVVDAYYDPALKEARLDRLAEAGARGRAASTSSAPISPTRRRSRVPSPRTGSTG
jgi:nucleoside-diphosphate-sugar epimerase